jgi:type IV pilus assembly protein PilM
MYNQDRHVATRDFDIGLVNLDDIIADKYGVDRHLAHTYVMNNFENCLESEECITFYDNVAVELMRAINFYEFSNQGSSLNDLWVCGGGSFNEALVRTIDETLNAQIHFASELVPDGDSIEQCNNFVQAIGVTLEI